MEHVMCSRRSEVTSPTRPRHAAADFCPHTPMLHGLRRVRSHGKPAIRDALYVRSHLTALRINYTQSLLIGEYRESWDQHTWVTESPPGLPSDLCGRQPWHSNRASQDAHHEYPGLVVGTGECPHGLPGAVETARVPRLSRMVLAAGL